jgi:hypothetical protein
MFLLFFKCGENLIKMKSEENCQIIWQNSKDILGKAKSHFAGLTEKWPGAGWNEWTSSQTHSTEVLLRMDQSYAVSAGWPQQSSLLGESHWELREPVSGWRLDTEGVGGTARVI